MPKVLWTTWTTTHNAFSIIKQVKNVTNIYVCQIQNNLKKDVFREAISEMCSCTHTCGLKRPLLSSAISAALFHNFLHGRSLFFCTRLLSFLYVQADTLPNKRIATLAWNELASHKYMPWANMLQYWVQRALSETPFNKIAHIVTTAWIKDGSSL